MGRRVKERKRVILIAVEGKNKTEKIYFSNYDDGSKNYRIVFAKGNYTDPLNLLNALIKEINRLELNIKRTDKAYLIFDTDTNSKKDEIIKSVRKLALKHNIEVITSTPSIEIWFLLHYEYTTSQMNNKELINRLKYFYSQYQKNTNIYSKICNYTITAVERSIKLIKYQEENNNEIGTTESNPCTEVHKIINELTKKE